VSVLGLGPAEADRIGRDLGHWPVFADASAGLSALLAFAPCVAMTNSDLQHASGVRQGLGFSLSHWICAEELGLYKPAPGFWHAVSRRLGVAPSLAWWHVSAYADYDLDVARALGLTTVFVTRPHQRSGSAHFTVRDLNELAELAAQHQ
jgi:FMN phosphatase YigB (HAD superfamily)